MSTPSRAATPSPVPEARMALTPILMGVGFAFIWASAFTTSRIIVTAFPPLTALVIRFGLSGLIGMAVAYGMGQRLQFSTAEWRRLVIFGVCQNALYLGLFWVAMQWIEASAASIIASVMPLLVALAGWAWMGERLRPMAVAGLIIGFLGVAIIMGVRLSHGLNLGGLALCAIGVMALTAATLASRGTGAGPNVFMAVAVQMLVGAAALVPPAVMLEWGRPLTLNATTGAAMLYSIVVPGLYATWLWFRLVARVGAVRAATFHFLSPLFGVAIAAALLGERFGASDVIGAGVIAAGILMVQLSRVPPARA